MITFQILKNTVPFKKLKAKSIEEALGMLKELARTSKDDYFELKSPEGRLIPAFT